MLKFKYMEEHRELPDPNRLSILVSTILLAYAVTPFVNAFQRGLEVDLPGVIFQFNINVATIVSVLVAGLAAVGADWLIRSHPRLGNQNSWQHSLLPALTAWVIGVPLNSLEIGPQWWAVFALGGLLLILVLLAEYIVVDLSDSLHAVATVGLTAVSFALYLIMAIAVRAAGLRLYLMLPALVPVLVLVCGRALFLRLGGSWKWAWAFGIALTVGQLALALHYWPMSPLSFGLVLLGPAYALTSLVGTMEEGRPLPTVWIEPVVMLTILWGLAVIFS